MNPQELKKKRTESILKGLIPEALSELEDIYLKGLCVTEVKCYKGRYDAHIYLDEMMLTNDEQKLVLEKLHKVKRYIQNYCADKEGWFKAPNLSFEFDKLLHKQNHIDTIFKAMEQELSKAKNDN